jgi:hypothetical protein
MGRGFGSTAPTVALIAAICLLWVYPFCLFHQVPTVAFQRIASPESDHSSPPPVLCDAHVLHVVVAVQGTGVGEKAGLSHRSYPLSTTVREQFWGVRHHELSGALLPGSRSALRASSNKLHSLYAVYQI